MCSTEQVVHHYPHAPHIHFIIVGAARPDLWRHVDRSAAVGGEHLVGHDLADAKIGQLEQSYWRIGRKQQVLRFDIAVHDVHLVAVPDCIDYYLHVLPI